MDRDKILMIFGAALVGASLLTWLLYRATTGAKQEKLVNIVAATRDIPAGTRLSSGVLKSIVVAEKDIPRGAMTDQKLLLDRVLLFPVTSNEAITVPKLASLMGAEGVAAIIEPGKRAVSVQVNDSTSAAGLVTPRGHVDVLFTRPGSMQEAVTTTVLQDIVVLSVGRVTEAAPTTASGTAAPAPSATQSRAVTLLVTPEQAEKLELAKNQGKISLSLRNPLDKSVNDELAPTTAINLYDPSALRRFPGRNGAPGSVSQIPRGSNIWAQMTGQQPEKPKKPEAPKEPPKPRFVVDVYRGDKHVQEIFQ